MTENEIKNEQIKNEIYGSFFLSESEFALAASSVQEVVNAPSKYTVVPLAPSYLKGLFNLRGTVIPVLDLSELLGLESGERTDSLKIAIVELEGCCVGLLFDKTGEVFRSNYEERSDFDDPSSTSVISGVFKKDSGNRIIQILDISKVFKLQNVPKDSGRNRLARENLGNKRGLRKQCISFVVGPTKCALPISEIQEIIKLPEISETALSVGHCLGTIDLRGTTVPLIDFAAFLKFREVDRSKTATGGDRRIVIMRLDQEFFGLLVDSIDSIISYFPDQLLSFPLVAQERAEMILGCISGHGDADILLLEHNRILSNEEVSEITHGHSRLFQRFSNNKKAEKAAGGPRKTYITFSVDESYAVSIKEVNEIIDYPEKLLQPPGLQKHVRGVLNLRGHLVTIIDARSMYSADYSKPSDRTQKVLVFKRNDVHFGLVVDSVESILTIADNEKVKIPEILYQKGNNSMSSDVVEAVEITDATGTKRSMLILSADSVASRATKSMAA